MTKTMPEIQEIEEQMLVDLEERIADGFCWLDNHHPSGDRWVEDIDPEQLRLDQPHRCVLGLVAKELAASRGLKPEDVCFWSVVPEQRAAWDNPSTSCVRDLLGIGKQIARLQEAIPGFDLAKYSAKWPGMHGFDEPYQWKYDLAQDMEVNATEFALDWEEWSFRVGRAQSNLRHMVEGTVAANGKTMFDLMEQIWQRRIDLRLGEIMDRPLERPEC